jgi:methyl-accepting chemotaxis protein
VVLVLAAAAATFGLLRMNAALGSYQSLLNGSLSAAKQLDDVNTAFVSRHKVLKDIYLFNTDSAKVALVTKELADWDQLVGDGLARLRQDSTLTQNDRDLIDSAVDALGAYQAASRAAAARATAGDDPYTAQQEAAKLTSGKDRPISAAFKELSGRLNDRAHNEAADIQAQVAGLLPAVLSVFGAAILLGIVVAFGLARTIVGAAQQIARAARGLAVGDLDQHVTLQSGDELGQMAEALRQVS